MESRFSRCCKKSVKGASELAPVFEGDAHKQQNYLHTRIRTKNFIPIPVSIPLFDLDTDSDTTLG